MDQPWNTRSGEKTERQTPQGGEDFAQLQRAQNAPRRDRATVQAQKESEAIKRRVHLEERARDQRILEFLRSKLFLGAIAGIGVALVLWLLVWPQIDQMLHPKADTSDLRSTRPQIALRASQILRGEAQPRLVDGASAWVLVYTLPRGSETFSGAPAGRTCSVSFRVSKNQPSHPQLRWSQQGRKTCR